MRKLHVKMGPSWVPVFCYNGDRLVTCQDHKKALPQKAIWANDDLKFFKAKFSQFEFSLFVPGRAPTCEKSIITI